MKTLYQEVETQLNDHLPLDWHFELRRRVMTLMMGILLSENCSPQQMAQALYQHGISDAQADSIARQIRRMGCRQFSTSFDLLAHRLALL